MYLQVLIKNLRYKRNNHLFGITLQTLSQLHHSHRQQFLFLLLHLPPVFDGLTLYNRSLMHMQHGDIDLIILLIVPEHIHIACRRGRDDRLALELL